ncbi:MAG: Hsp20/alpha crystallin family protein [Proteobacteria bacterium]|nr:Hsp20/alpha crystallin family protein [Pseudomonadota bacterium]NDC23467.1 Hsp20/alpha crystallin family protein [Pseudomonadota bacterium]NDD03365.1 Hsp20/alpha crystallin family protein [Pseudomonadota bacterium]NDG25732.1 Hsp20/alpha crystallin family protein [Pseudomonadota bacterium]
MRNRLSLWRPERMLTFRDLSNIQRRFDQLWEDVIEPSPNLSAQEFDYSSPCDVEETDSHYVMSLDVPGIPKENLKVEVQGDCLVITGSRKEERVSRKGEPEISERSQGRFYRSMSIPGLTEDSKIEAAYKDGVLRVAVPKAPSSRGRTVPIGEEKGGFWTKLLGRSEEKKVEKAA